MGGSEFSDISISVESTLPCGNDCPVGVSCGSGYFVKKGAAIRNKGMMFEGDAAFVGNAAVTGYNWVQGKAGAVSNTKSGSILFKGKAHGARKRDRRNVRGECWRFPQQG
eukprot:g7548.t1